MNYQRAFFLLAFSILTLGAQAQQPWTLQRCISYIEENNLNLKQMEFQVENAEWQLKQSQFSRIPSLNADARGGVQFGRTIDPTTNSFDNQTIGFNSYSLNGGIPVYNGNAINRSIQRDKLDLKATKLEAEDLFNTLALSAASSYLEILLAQEQLENAKQQVAQTEAQLEQIDRLIQAGALPKNDRLDVLAQLALNEQNAIQAENALSIAKLSLKNLLQIDPSEPIDVVQPDVDKVFVSSDPDNYSADEVYVNALGIMPIIEANDLRLQSAEKNVDVLRSQMLPNLFLFGSLSTNWSSVGQVVDGTTIAFVPINVRNPVDGTVTTLEFGQEVPVFSDASYFNQLQTNFGQSVGMTLNIPIFNNYSNKVRVEQSKLGVLTARLNRTANRQQLKVDVQNAVNNARAAKRIYNAAQTSLEAATVAYENAEKQFEVGAFNTFELTTAKIRKDTAEIELIRAKYQYLFNLKVVDFYQGKSLDIQ
ncbi:MAG: TolC family protein [Bacteroidota bacterium]